MRSIRPDRSSKTLLRYARAERSLAHIFGAAAATVALSYVWQRSISMTTLPMFADLVAALARPAPGMDIYDPAAGTGMLLAAADRHAQRSSVSGQEASTALPRLFGQELDPLSYSIGRLHFALRGLDVRYVRGDTLRQPAFVDGESVQQFDCVVANPVWEQAVPSEVFSSDPYRRFVHGVPPRDCADWGWLQHGLASLSERGRMAAVIDAGALHRSSRNPHGPSEREIRESCLRADLIEAVVWCGHGHRYTGNRIIDGVAAPRLAQSGVIVASRAKEHPGEVLMIDPARLVQADVARPRNVLAEVIALHDSWSELSGVSARVDVESVINMESDLRPSSYL